MSEVIRYWVPLEDNAPSAEEVVLAADYDALKSELATERLRADMAVSNAHPALHAPAVVVVMPARMTTIPEGKTISYAAGYEAALDAVASLNRNTVPLELLWRITKFVEQNTHYQFGEPLTSFDASGGRIMGELRAILGGVAKP